MSLSEFIEGLRNAHAGLKETPEAIIESTDRVTSVALTHVSPGVEPRQKSNAINVIVAASIVEAELLKKNPL